MENVVLMPALTQYTFPPLGVCLNSCTGQCECDCVTKSFSTVSVDILIGFYSIHRLLYRDFRHQKVFLCTFRGSALF